MMIIKKTWELNAEINEAAELINSIFAKEEYGIKERIKPEEICFDDQTLGGKVYRERYEEEGEFLTAIYNRNRRLSEIIFNHYFLEPAKSTFFHFTSLQNAESIIRNNELWLFNLVKRADEDEYTKFYENHNLKGYDKETDEAGLNMYLSVMKELFYTSFAHSNSVNKESEERLWRSFGEKGCGVKLEFEISPLTKDFRHIFYKSETKLKLLINELTDAIQKKYNRVFFVSGISKMGALYLPDGFDEENEVRLMVKKNTDAYPFNFTIYEDNAIEHSQYIKLKFDSDYAKIKLVSIQPGRFCSTQTVKQIIDLNYGTEEIKPRILEKSTL